MIPWSFSSHHNEKQPNADYILPVKSNWEDFRFIEIKIRYYVHVILHLNGRNQFPTRNTKFVISVVHVKSVASE